jgi:threonine dehydratase
MAEIDAASLSAARAVLAPVIRPTPSTFSHSLTSRFGREVWLKPEFRQRTGSFKIRGAYLMQSRLPEGTAVVAASAGNHAQGVALAARTLGQAATIFMPIGASLPKVQATIAYGARVEIVGDTVDDCLAIARDHAAATGAVFVPPFDHPDIVLGQATIAPELLDEVAGLSNVVVAIGGGGLCGGIAAGIKALRPEARVVGVAAEGAASIRGSLAAGRPIEVVPHTLADGIALRAPSALTLDLIRRFVDEVVVVGDEQISQAMLLLAERAKAVVEPAGAVPLAAMLADVPLAQGPTALVLGGGNVDPLLFAKLIEHGLGAAGRYLSLQIVMDDRPGSLASLTQQVATLRLNVLDVEHHRSGRRLPLGSVEVQLTVETRDQGHQIEVMTSLRSAGFQVEPIA